MIAYLSQVTSTVDEGDSPGQVLSDAVTKWQRLCDARYSRMLGRHAALKQDFLDRRVSRDGDNPGECQ
jgi:hypothetical protein